MRPTTETGDRGSEGSPSWWQDASRGRVVLAAVLFSVAIFLVDVLFDYLSLRAASYKVMMVVLDAAIAIVGGALLFRIVRDAQARHRMLMGRLAMIAALNHNVRNALDAIQLSAYSTHDRKLIAEVQVAVNRVQRALRDVVPTEEEGNA